MTNQTAFSPIAALDLERIKTKLCHVESGEGWSRSRADAAAVEYRRFLYLMKAFPNELTVPSVEVDTFWHYHILDTRKYAADCAAVFGYFLHHDPAVGLAGESEAPERLRRAARMRSLYRGTFGAALATSAAAYCGAKVSKRGATSSYCGIVGPSTVTPADATSSYCGIVGPSTATPADAAASYCGIVGPSTVTPADAVASYCGIVGPSTVQPDPVFADAIPA